MSAGPSVQAFHDPDTSTLTYVVWDPEATEAVVIDPVWDYRSEDSTLSDASARQVLDFLLRQKLSLRAILETHAHADHISGAQVLKKYFPGCPLMIGEKISAVQRDFREVFNLGENFPIDGRQFDRLLKNGEELALGTLRLKVLFTPGHTPACCSYVIGDCVFTGDALFMPDCGTGRCDFPGGSAAELYHSIREVLYQLPNTVRVFPGHDYQPHGRPVAWESTIHQQKAENIHLKMGTTSADFIRFRTERDRTLCPPKLLLPSIQLNIGAGTLPPPNEKGQRYLKIPLREMK